MAEPCPHGIEDASWCSLCLRGLSKPPSVSVMTGPFTARHDGHCRGCDLPISAGQRIVGLTNDTYVHDDEGCRP